MRIFSLIGTLERRSECPDSRPNCLLCLFLLATLNHVIRVLLLLSSSRTPSYLSSLLLCGVLPYRYCPILVLLYSIEATRYLTLFHYSTQNQDPCKVALPLRMMMRIIRTNHNRLLRTYLGSIRTPMYFSMYIMHCQCQGSNGFTRRLQTTRLPLRLATYHADSSLPSFLFCISDAKALMSPHGALPTAP
jgi:hypothetical protein